VEVLNENRRVHYAYMCSDPGQDLIKSDIEEMGLNRVVVASCSPTMHERTFRGACEEAGLNPFFFQMANIREQCSWVTVDAGEATRKAKGIVAAAVRRVRALSRAVRGQAGAGAPGGVGGGRGDCGDRGRTADRRLGAQGVPGGARALDRRPYGATVQDLSYARLFGLNTDTQDGVRGTA